MAYPVTYPLRTRYYSEQCTSTAATIGVVVGARGKYLGGQAACLSSDVLTTVFDVLVNGVGVTGSTGISVTSSTVTNKGGGVAIPLPNPVLYVAAGDVLGTSYTSSLGGFTVTHVVQEF
jgi:hypothetical protein